jgi:hypothetical protein
LALHCINSERCEDLRTLKSQRFTKEAKSGQEYQMREQEHIKEQEREAERMWAAVAEKEYEEKVREATISICKHTHIHT